MTVFESDDDIYRAKFPYLGPPGYTLPIHLTYPQWGLFTALAVGFTLVGLPVFGPWLGLGMGIGAAILTTTIVSGHVNPDRPVRMVLATALTDWRHHPLPAGNQPLGRLDGRHIHIRDLR